jgi:hypothetical protein
VIFWGLVDPRFCRGVLAKMGEKAWCFDGEVVVNSWWDDGFWMVLFRR